MSVYKPAGSPFWHFDFQVQRRRFYGSTGRKSRRDAENVERAEREKAKALLKQQAVGAEALTLDNAAGRYWLEIGQHHAQAGTTWTDIERLVGFLGKDRLLSKITDDDVSRFVAWRREHRVRGRSKDKKGMDVPLVSAATVNRSTTQLLQKIFTRAKRSWGARFDREPDWRHHRLPEPKERVRELSGDEAERIDAAMRDDFAPVFDFAWATGQRLAECIVRWAEVNWQAGQIVKGG